LALGRLAVLVGAVAATAAVVGAAIVVVRRVVPAPGQGAAVARQVSTHRAPTAATAAAPPTVNRSPSPALTLPFDGVWGVVQGFDSGETHHGYAAFALDFTPPQDVAQFARLVHPRLQDFACFGRPVLAPADGQVVRVATGFPDLPPYANPVKPKVKPNAKRSRRGDSDSGSGSGNFVIIQHADRVYTELVHLQAGSVRVAVGDHVRRGQPIGACGNSGNARTPHLHLGLLSSIDPITTVRLALTSYEVRDPRDPNPTRWIPGDGEPKQGQWVRPTARQPSASDSSGR
jgi:murein DD-endopeptidase MepM/ murein hydrolase activator NlpD